MPESAARPEGGARSLPVNLLVKGRLCLLFGAGHVAHRKCSSLLEHGARVVLVAPRANARIRRLAEEGRVEVIEGRYDPALIEEQEPFLIYAATDDDETNRRIAADARDRGILASTASSWEEGDFISPSRILWGRGQVSFSTEGASCRQAKFMRLRLSELLGGDRELLLLGVDLRRLTLEEFERVRPSAKRVRELTGLLRHLAALEEFVLLATCNRLELYAWSRKEDDLLTATLTMLGLGEYADRVYVKTGDEVTEHAASVVSGLFSQVICETQITGQFKAAFKLAFEADVAGVHMQNLHDRALTLGKRIRSLAAAGAEGLPDLVSGVIRQRMDREGARVLVLGAGPLGREVAGRISSIPGVAFTWANRTRGRMPPEPAGLRLSLSDALLRLGEFDQVVSVLGAGGPVIRREHLDGAPGAPLLLDLGLPRNVDPEVSALGLAEVMDLGHFRKSDVERDRLLALAHSVTHG